MPRRTVRTRSARTVFDGHFVPNLPVNRDNPTVKHAHPRTVTFLLLCHCPVERQRTAVSARRARERFRSWNDHRQSWAVLRASTSLQVVSDVAAASAVMDQTGSLESDEARGATRMSSHSTGSAQHKIRDATPCTDLESRLIHRGRSLSSAAGREGCRVVTKVGSNEVRGVVRWTATAG